ncbi:MAG: NADP-dependent isocitrate dehydrogenase, partial [FCB group bacterium]|nr:NADP-dependent isocitrate dehydrogenase [FCB group bacterium]
MSQKIIWTKTDEAPALATVSLLPILNAFTKVAGVEVEVSDISVAGRIIAAFPERLNPEQRVEDALTKLGELTQSPEANIIKLPNISASLPQLKAAIAELQSKGYDLPDYPDEAVNDEDKEVQSRYSKILGSAVNPVLREGNSDRRSAAAVKNFARKFPHSMGTWSHDSKSHVSTMNTGDFRHNEKSMTQEADTIASIVFKGKDGQKQVLKSELTLSKGEIMDATFMSVKKLRAFLREQIADARSRGVLFSLHMKATMMKVSDPVIFGHCVQVFFEELIAKHRDTFDKLGVNWSNGFGDLMKKLDQLEPDKQAEIKADIQAVYATQPDLAMVNSDRGITNLHVPSDIIVDASMPAAIRASGQMWNKLGNQQDTKFTIPDSTYAPLYQKTIEDHIAHGAIDVTTAGSVANVGLMAQKAEEYGSHPTTFVMPGDGIVEILDDTGNVLLFSEVEKDDIWRAVFVKDGAVHDWVKLAVNRAKASGWLVIFWLDEDRPHTAELIKKVKLYLSEQNTSGLDIRIM